MFANMENFLKDLAGLLMLEQKDLARDFCLDNCMHWDSLSKVSSLGLICQYFDIQVSIENILRVKTVGDLLDIIDNGINSK